MALDPSIALQGTPVNPQPFNPLPAVQAFTQLQSARALQEQREAIADDRQVQTQARIQQAADTASINAAVQQFNGDPYQASDFLRQNGKATAADQLDSATSKNNSASQAAVKMHLDNQGLINTQATQMLQAATPQNWPIVRTNVLNMVNSVDPVQAKNFAPMLPEQFDPAAVGAALKVGETHQEYVNQNLEALKYFQGQDFKNGLATALSVAPDQTQGTILGKGDILKSAKIWGAQDKDLLWAQQLVQSGAQGKQYLEAAQTPAEQIAAGKATTKPVLLDGKPAELRQNEQGRFVDDEGNIIPSSRVRPIPPASAANTVVLNSGALDQAAQRYLDTGTLPSLGMGNSSTRQQIMNRASALNSGANLAANSAEYAANKATLTPLTKQLNSLQAFENTANSNLKQFTDLAAKIPDTGVPWLNTPVRALDQNVVGSTLMPAVNAARQVALTEISRIVSNPNLTGQLSDSARSEVMGLSPANATIPQIKAVVKVLQQDMANRRTALQAQVADIQQRLGIKSTPTGVSTSDPLGIRKGG